MIFYSDFRVGDLVTLSPTGEQVLLRYLDNQNNTIIKEIMEIFEIEQDGYIRMKNRHGGAFGWIPIHFILIQRAQI